MEPDVELAWPVMAMEPDGIISHHLVVSLPNCYFVISSTLSSYICYRRE